MQLLLTIQHVKNVYMFTVHR